MLNELFVFAHGVGGRSDLPISTWTAAWSGAAGLLLSFAALGLLWHKPRFAKIAEGRPAQKGERFVSSLQRVLRAFLLALFFVVLVGGFVGPDTTTGNLTPVTVYIIFWIGGSFLSALFGPWWRMVSPWETLGNLVDRLRPQKDHTPPKWLSSGWAAMVPISLFHWLELAYHNGSSPRTLGWAMLLYTIWLMAMAWQWGWENARKAEGFGVLFQLIAALSPLHADQHQRLKVRAPFVGVAAVTMTPALIALVLAALGGTAFDGVSRTGWWGDLTVGQGGWGLTAVRSMGLVWVALLVGLAYQLASRLGGQITRDLSFAERFGATLIPILVGYDLAHYFSLFLLEGQDFLRLISDPWGQGWDLFGTANRLTNWTLVSTLVVGWVQIAAIVGGHVLGVFFAHDRSIELWRPQIALRSQYPMLLVMVVYTMTGLILLTG